MATVSKASQTPTPGPWDHAARSVTVYAHYSDGGDLTKICDTSTHNKDVPTAVANARLIAAAPDLVAALERLYEPMASWGQCSYCRDGAEDTGHDPDCPFEQARGALAKAKGEAPAN